MQAHIIDLQRLVRLTNNSDSLRVLHEAITAAKAQDRDEARQARRAARYQARRQRQQDSGALRCRLRRVEWRRLNVMRVESQMGLQLGQGISGQDTTQGYLRSYWLEQQGLHPGVSSTVV